MMTKETALNYVQSDIEDIAVCMAYTLDDEFQYNYNKLTNKIEPIKKQLNEYEKRLTELEEAAAEKYLYLAKLKKEEAERVLKESN